MSHFGLNHVLGNLTALNMNVQNFQHLQNLQQHGDVLEKLKMQVRDINVGIMEKEFPMHSPFGNTLPTPTNTAFTLPQINNSQPQNLTANTNGFPFTPPNAPCLKDGKIFIIIFFIC